MSPRPRLSAGTYGTINLTEISDGYWRARTRYRFEDGKRRQVERTGESKAKAEKALKDALLVIETPSSAQITKAMTLSQLADIFIDHKKEVGRAIRSIDTYAFNANTIIKPAIGQLTIGEATTGRLQAFISKVQKVNGHGSAKGCRSVLSGMMALAVRNDAILTNPVAGVAGIEKPKGKRGSKAVPVSELPAFLDTIKNDPEMKRLDIADLWEFLAFVGCRIGAALALRWENVDFENGTITFAATVIRPHGDKLQIQEYQKTEASARTIQPPQATMKLLKRRFDTMPPNEHGVVFPSMLGNLRDPSNTEADWRSNRERLGYPELTSQGFRKTVTDILTDQGLSARDVADYLGQADISVTQNVYMSRKVKSTKASAALENFISESAE